MDQTDTPSESSGNRSAAGPITERERIMSLDVLRGFALFGIFMVNMQFFAMPFFMGIADPAITEAPLSERLAMLGVKWLFEYKFISMFSLLFGIGFVVQLARTRQRGGPFVPQYLRRLGILFLIGFVHAIGLWYGDILLIYSITAIALLLCASLSPRTLMILAVAALLFAAALGFGINLLQYMGASAGNMDEMIAHGAKVVAAGEAASGIEAMKQANFQPMNPIWIDAELRAYRDGPFMDALAFRAMSYMFALLFAGLSYGWHVLAMFLLGAALMKLNFFAADKRHWHRRLALIALPLGVLLEAVNVLAFWASDFTFSLEMVLMIPVHEISSVLLMLGYVGVICLVVQGGYLKWLTTPIAAAGRMALTVYLGETIITTAIMYWWGLGMFGSFSRVEMIGLVVLIYAALVAQSVLWLRYFRFGPMEWLWRALTYMRLQPIRR